MGEPLVNKLSKADAEALLSGEYDKISDAGKKVISGEFTDDKDRGSIVDPLLQGPTLGFSDEIAGVVSGVKAFANSDDDRWNAFKNAYETESQRWRDDLAAYRQREPVAATVAELGGGALTGLVGGTRAAGTAAMRNLPQWLRHMASGAAVGATAGLGSADPGQRISGMSLGGLTGGTIGAAAPAAGRLAGEIGRTVKSKFAGPGSLSDRKILQAMRRDDMTPDMVETRMRELGDDAVLAESGGENLLSLGRDIAAVPGPGKNVAERVLNARQYEQPDRVIAAVTKKTGSDDLYGVIDNIDESMRKLAGPAYNKAYSYPLEMTDTLAELLERPSIKQAIRFAKSTAAERGKPLPVDANGELIWDMRTLGLVKEGLGTVIDKKHKNVFGKIIGSDGRAVVITKGELVDEMNRQTNNAYGDALKIYSDKASMKEAGLKGMSLFKGDSDLAIREISAMSDAEKAAFRVGMAKAIRDKIDKDGADAYKQIFNRRSFRARIRAAFDDDEAFRHFEETMANEGHKYRTRGYTLGGSHTQRIASGIEDMSVDPNMAVDAAVGNWRAVATNLMRRGVGQLRNPTEELRTSLGNELFSTDPAMQAELFRRLGMKFDPAVEEALRNRAVGVTSSMAPIIPLGGSILEDY